MTDQEMQMMAFMAAARGGNKNLSGVLNNMDNQLLAIMAGAYDPRTAEQSGPGAGSYWSRYSQSENPIIQDVISKITSGADKFQISSYIDSIAAPGIDLGGFQVADLKGVAGELYKEYTGTSTGSSSSKNKTATQKAGIPDPTELYNTSTVPLSSINEQYIRKLQEDLVPKVKGYGDAQYKVNSAREGLGRGSSATEEGKRIKTADVLKWFDEESSKGRGALGLNRARSYFKNNPVDDISVSDLTGVLDKSGSDSLKYSNNRGGDAKGFGKAVKNITKKAGSSRGVGYNKAANKKYDDAMQVMLDMEGSANAAKQREQAVREGQMDYARQSGATPTTDAMKMIMKFIASSK
jgi:hypothetical protein